MRCQHGTMTLDVSGASSAMRCGSGSSDALATTISLLRGAMIGIRKWPSGASEVWVQQRQDRAQARFLAAIKALAQVRKLLKPGTTVQVNIAQQQVNLG